MVIIGVWSLTSPTLMYTTNIPNNKTYTLVVSYTSKNLGVIHVILNCVLNSLYHLTIPIFRGYLLSRQRGTFSGACYITVGTNW